MTRTFIHSDEFTKNWSRLKLTDDDLRKLEIEIIKNPKVGKVIKGTGRLRKMRFAANKEGKSGGKRVCYVDFAVMETIYLITVYAKDEKENLTKEECNNIKKAIDILEASLQSGKEQK